MRRKMHAAMNMTTQNAKEERRMTRYLLGAATEEERVEIEGRFLRDAEYLKQLRAIECEIIDDYVGGEMPSAERRSFERRALASPQGREQVARARKLHAQLDHIAAENREPSPLTAEPREGPWEKLRARHFTPAAIFQYGTPRGRFRRTGSDQRNRTQFGRAAQIEHSNELAFCEAAT